MENWQGVIGKQAHFVPFPTLIQWAATGKVMPETPVKGPGMDWIRASDVPALNREFVARRTRVLLVGLVAVGLAFVVVAFGLVLAARRSVHVPNPVVRQPSPERPQLPPPPPISVTAPALQTLYLENEIAADARFKGKRLQVRGLVREIGTDVAGRSYVFLADPRTPGGVQCRFDEPPSGIETLKPGDTVEIVGTCKGRVLAIVILSNCSPP